MLRNFKVTNYRSDKDFSFLNEVLSLNAQESSTRMSPPFRESFLNEVLSLNAQEFGPPPIRIGNSIIPQ